jgi:5'-nucleotidase (lipoprotein e(P4) family)
MNSANCARRRLWLSLALFVLAVSSNASAQGNPEPANKEYEVGATLWQQSSGERNALSYQAFALARMMLDRDLRRHTRMKRAVIVDVDETILDNSRHEAWQIKNNRNYNSKDWTEWCKRAEADAVPGAVEFLRYANSRGVRVFYITNRKDIEKDGTARNLKRLGFPEVTDETLLVRKDSETSSKEGRRSDVAKKYHVVLLMGDDLNDFAAVFEQSTTVASRIAAADQNKNQFGTRFIMLPNPMYGHWLDVINADMTGLSEAEKAAKRKSLLRD